MEIRSISEKIFNTASNNKIENANLTNPFGVAFKGNIINADVFEKSEQPKASFGVNLAQKIANRKNKLTHCVNVGINSMNSWFSARVNSVARFGKRIQDNVHQAWDFLNTKKISLNFEKDGFALKFINGNKNNPISVFLGDLKYRQETLNNTEVNDLGKMLEEQLALGGV